MRFLLLASLLAIVIFSVASKETTVPARPPKVPHSGDPHEYCIASTSDFQNSLQKAFEGLKGCNAGGSIIVDSPIEGSLEIDGTGSSLTSLAVFYTQHYRPGKTKWKNIVLIISGFKGDSESSLSFESVPYLYLYESSFERGKEAVTVDKSTKEFTVDYCTFNAISDSPAIVSYSPLNIYNSTFTNNKLGAVFVSTSGTVNVLDSVFNGNTASSGAALRCDDRGKLNLGNLTIINGSAAKNGGAVSGSSVHAYNCTFQGNSATLLGGAIYATDSSSVVFSIFKDNTASHGPTAAFLGGELTLSMDNDFQSEVYLSKEVSVIGFEGADVTDGSVPLVCENAIVGNPLYSSQGLEGHNPLYEGTSIARNTGTTPSVHSDSKFRCSSCDEICGFGTCDSSSACTCRKGWIGSSCTITEITTSVPSLCSRFTARIPTLEKGDSVRWNIKPELPGAREFSSDDTITVNPYPGTYTISAVVTNARGVTVFLSKEVTFPSPKPLITVDGLTESKSFPVWKDLLVQVSFAGCKPGELPLAASAEWYLSKKVYDFMDDKQHEAAFTIPAFTFKPQESSEITLRLTDIVTKKEKVLSYQMYFDYSEIEVVGKGNSLRSVKKNDEFTLVAVAYDPDDPNNLSEPFTWEWSCQSSDSTCPEVKSDSSVLQVEKGINEKGTFTIVAMAKKEAKKEAKKAKAHSFVVVVTGETSPTCGSYARIVRSKSNVKNNKRASESASDYDVPRFIAGTNVTFVVEASLDATVFEFEPPIEFLRKGWDGSVKGSSKQLRKGWDGSVKGFGYVSARIPDDVACGSENMYTISSTVKNDLDETCTSETSFIVLCKPEGDSFQLSSTSGEFFRTIFTATAYNWKSPNDLPLTYTWDYSFEGSDTKVPISGGTSTESSFIVIPPSGKTSGEFNVVVQLSVSDYEGNTKTTQQKLSLKFAQFLDTVNPDTVKEFLLSNSPLTLVQVIAVENPIFVGQTDTHTNVLSALKTAGSTAPSDAESIKQLIENLANIFSSPSSLDDEKVLSAAKNLFSTLLNNLDETSVFDPQTASAGLSLLQLSYSSDSFDSFEKIVTLLLNGHTCGSTPTVVKSGGIELTVRSFFPYDLSGDLGGLVTLPEGLVQSDNEECYQASVAKFPSDLTNPNAKPDSLKDGNSTTVISIEIYQGDFSSLKNPAQICFPLSPQDSKLDLYVAYRENPEDEWTRDSTVKTLKEEFKDHVHICGMTNHFSQYTVFVQPFTCSCVHGYCIDGGCSCESGKTGLLCEFDAPDHSPSAIQSTGLNFTTSFDYTPTDKLSVEIKVPSVSGCLSGGSDNGNCGTFTLISFLGGSNKCNYPVNTDWQLSSSSDGFDLYKNTFTYSQLTDCGLSDSGENSTYHQFNHDLVVRRGYQLSKGQFTLYRNSSSPFHYSVVFPRRESVSTSVHVVDDTLVQFTALTNSNYNITLDKWEITLSAVTRAPYYLNASHFISLDTTPSADLNRVHLELNPSECSPSPTSIQNCQQTFRILVDGCAAFKLNLTARFDVGCRSDFPYANLGEGCIDSATPFVTPGFDIFSSSSCPSEKTAIFELFMSSFKDSQLSKPEEHFGQSQTLFFAVAFSTPASISQVVLDSVCIPTGTGPCDDADEITFSNNVGTNAISSLFSQPIQASFSVNGNAIADKMSLSSTAFTTVYVQADLTITYTGGFQQKRSVLVSSARSKIAIQGASYEINPNVAEKSGSISLSCFLGLSLWILFL
eukprot:TRINITY_DN4878_c0_g1_i2.p1 TRINITY_DN4878_c0_g1~~TRINITY_DN4878_c0_g1_i2.p1  ORF type:complete len:1726 (-),score=413.06 TRINITY_DN4878_c0_g1_i2:87-5264(-)